MGRKDKGRGSSDRGDRRGPKEGCGLRGVKGVVMGVGESLVEEQTLQDIGGSGGDGEFNPIVTRCHWRVFKQVKGVI